jgi:hypothetical protein
MAAGDDSWRTAQERLLASIEKHLAVRDGDVCEIWP